MIVSEGLKLERGCVEGCLLGCREKPIESLKWELVLHTAGESPTQQQIGTRGASQSATVSLWLLLLTGPSSTTAWQIICLAVVFSEVQSFRKSNGVGSRQPLQGSPSVSTPVIICPQKESGQLSIAKNC